MNTLSLSLHDEMNNVFAQRALKLALALALHAAVAGLVMHLPKISAANYIPARLETRPMQVSFVQVQPAAKASQQSAQVVKPRADAAKLPKKNASHPTHKYEPAASHPAFATTPNSAPLSTFAAPSAAPMKEVASEAATPAKTTPLIAAHVDASYSQKTPPTYPTMSRRLHEEGKVQLLVDVSAKGDVESILVKQSSGFPRLDDVALNTVRLWRFVPARRGDVPVADSVVVPIQFKLNN